MQRSHAGPSVPSFYIDRTVVASSCAARAAKRVAKIVKDMNKFGELSPKRQRKMLARIQAGDCLAVNAEMKQAGANVGAVFALLERDTEDEGEESDSDSDLDDLDSAPGPQGPHDFGGGMGGGAAPIAA